MKLILIGTDRKLFLEKSPVLERTLAYAGRIEELHFIVFTLRKEKHKFVQKGNLFLHPTNSFSRFSYIRSAKKLANQVISQYNLDKGKTVVSSQDPFETGLVGLYVKNNFKFPFQVQIHTDFLSKHFSKTFLNIIRIEISKKVLKSADGIRTVSENMKEALLKNKKIKAQVDVLPIYVDVERISSFAPLKDLEKEFPQFNFIIFMASRLESEKRFDTALYALAKIINQYPRVGLVIAGSGKEKRIIQRLARRLNLAQNVVLIGWQDELISYYKTCDVFLVTSEYEGYGMTLIEAAASGAIIVTTDVGIAKTNLFVNEENSFVSPVGDYEDIARKIIEVIQNNQKRELFSHRIEQSVRNNVKTLEAYSSEYVALLTKLVSE